MNRDHFALAMNDRNAIVPVLHEQVRSSVTLSLSRRERETVTGPPLMQRCKRHRVSINRGGPSETEMRTFQWEVLK